ncbi:MAG: DUF308 domain-containing protein [Prevotellaceae bacterium]|nr:DUF308 domain-containing protein [Prevotellaceae bacterium]
MKAINSPLLRAVCTLIVGVLLIMFPNETRQGLIIAIGLLFIIPGLATVIVYHINKNNEVKALAEGTADTTPQESRPMFPLAGWGSLLLGISIILLRDRFIDYLHIILSTILILLAIASFITLIRTSKYWKIGFGNFVMPVVVFIVGALIIFNVLGNVEMPTIQLILGLAFAFYGLVEIYYAIRIMRGKYVYKKKVAAEQKAFEERKQIEDTLNDVQDELDAEAEEKENNVEDIVAEEVKEEKKDIFD